MKVAWATDIHLNFVEAALAEAFCARIREAGCEAVLLGGDIAEAADFSTWLRFLDDRLDVPIYFVLGNHDYYGGNIATVRTEARALTSDSLQWLPAVGVVRLTSSTALVGHGGWGDARLGAFATSEVILNDYVVIADLRSVGAPTEGPMDPLAAWKNKPALQAKLEELGDDAAVTLRPHLEQALEAYPRALVLTHVPPFKEACWHKGQVSADDWLPGFTCRAMGDMLRDVAGRHPERDVRVLCGHTHGEGTARLLPNLEVRTQSADYGAPAFQILEVRD